MIEMSRPEIYVIIELEVVQGGYVTPVLVDEVAGDGQEQLQELVVVSRGVLVVVGTGWVALIFKHI